MTKHNMQIVPAEPIKVKLNASQPTLTVTRGDIVNITRALLSVPAEPEFKAGVIALAVALGIEVER
jgi:hypothetical protein